MLNTTELRNISRIVILSAADKRKELIEWSYTNKHALKGHIIISTARTAGLLEGTLNIPVLNLNHGRSGGYHQVKDLIEENHVDIILFFGDPMKTERKETVFIELISAAVQKDIVVAYNKATIDMVIGSIGSPGTELHHPIRSCGTN